MTSDSQSGSTPSLHKNITFDTISQPSKSVTSRWCHEETLLLLELLLQARRDQQLNNDKLSVVRDVLKVFIPTFSAEHPLRQWTLKILENRFSYLKNIWRAFRAAEARSGTTYHADTGMLEMSKQSVDFIVSVHKRYVKHVVSKPLPVNGNISPIEWGEIFRQDRPAMKNVLAADDDEGFKRAAAAEEEDVEEEGTEEEEERSTQKDQEGQEEVGGGTQDNNADDESPDQDVSDEYHQVVIFHRLGTYLTSLSRCGVWKRRRSSASSGQYPPASAKTRCNCAATVLYS